MNTNQKLLVTSTVFGTLNTIGMLTPVFETVVFAAFLAGTILPLVGIAYNLLGDEGA